MLRLKRLAVLNIVAICVIAGFFACVMRLPAPDTHSGQPLPRPHRPLRLKRPGPNCSGTARLARPDRRE
jgi:hypothetical protein